MTLPDNSQKLVAERREIWDAFSTLGLGPWHFIDWIEVAILYPLDSAYRSSCSSPHGPTFGSATNGNMTQASNSFWKVGDMFAGRLPHPTLYSLIALLT